MKIKDVLAYGVTAQGRNELMRFLKGKKLTRKDAIKAKCYECNNGYADGKRDCKIPACPLYGFMPYNSDKYVHDSNLTGEQKEARVAHMKRIRSTSTINRR